MISLRSKSSWPTVIEHGIVIEVDYSAVAVYCLLLRKADFTASLVAVPEYEEKNCYSTISML
jgi:hypothetical protein